MSTARKTAGQRARSLAKRQGRRQISAILPLISQAVEQASSKGLFRTDVALDGRWFQDETNQRDLRKALRVEHLDSANPRMSGGRFVLSIFWGDYPLEDSAYPVQPVLLGKATLLVTNASGQLGKATLKALEAHADLFKVRATTRTPSKQLSLEFPQVEWVGADLSDEQNTAAAVQGVAKIFHIPASAQRSVRLTQAQNIASAAAAANVQHIVDMSVVAAESRAIRIHDAMRDQEEALEAGKVPWTHLRTTYFMDNFVTMLASSIKNTNTFYLSLADAGVSMVAVADIARVAATLLTRAGAEGLTVNLTGPEVLTGKQCAEILSEELGREITYASASEEQFRSVMASYQQPEWRTDDLWELFELFQSHAAEKVSSDGQRILSNGSTNFRQLVRKNLAAF